MLSRRRFLATSAQVSAAAMVFGSAAFAKKSSFSPSPSDTALLEDLSHRCFRYFWEQSDAKTGIARDRAGADAGELPGDARDVGSTGATGFSLTACCIGAERGWVSRRQARERVRNTLSTFANGPVTQEHGWFYHFVDVHSGQRHGNSEISTSDCTWLVAGALTARHYFREDAEIVRLATLIYERTDYRWMLNGDPYLLSHGWKPDSGFIQYRYDKYCQLACMYLLGIASPTHSLDPAAWYAWGRDPYEYGDFHYNGKSLLWTYQYPFCWWDFRDRREARGTHVDWFENCSIATRAHRAFCIDLAKEFPQSYSTDIWGITSSASPRGYTAWGGPPGTKSIDGSVVPCAAAGSLMFTPDICLPALHAMKDRSGDRIWKRYGFVDAFNPTTGWVAPDCIGIDIGVTLLSAENLRTGNVWRWFMANPEAARAFDLAGIEAV